MNAVDVRRLLHERRQLGLAVGIPVVAVLLLLAKLGLLWVFLLVIADGVVPMIPGEAALLAHAPVALAAGGPAVLTLAAVAATAAFLGDTLTYTIGRRIGTTRFAWQRHPRVAPVLERTGTELDQRGLALIVSARLLPGWRVAVMFMAGATHLSWRRFLGAGALGATVWAGYLLVIGTTVGAATQAGPLVVAIVSLAVSALLTQGVRWVRTRARRRLATAPTQSAPRAVREPHSARVERGWLTPRPRVAPDTPRQRSGTHILRVQHVAGSPLPPARGDDPLTPRDEKREHARPPACCRPSSCRPTLNHQE